MGKVVANFSMSLDGFIAGTNGDDNGLHNWVFEGTVPVTVGGMTFHLTSQKSAEVFYEFVQNMGACVLGRRAFGAASENPLFQLPSFVLSNEERDEVLKEGTKITFVTDGIESALQQAKVAAGDKDVYVFGGANTVQQYLEAGLLEEIDIDLVPTLLGDGLRLFEHAGKGHIGLEKIESMDAPGVKHLSYRVTKAYL